jgi:hypothetical protein
MRDLRVIPFKDLDIGSLSESVLNPGDFCEGQLLLDFVTYWDPSFEYLQDFQQWRRLHAVQ